MAPNAASREPLHPEWKRHRPFYLNQRFEFPYSSPYSSLINFSQFNDFVEEFLARKIDRAGKLVPHYEPGHNRPNQHQTCLVP
jgi:hypothetical protein